jgi:RNA polymerase sigma-70 factor (ECF subfamily)
MLRSSGTEAIDELPAAYRIVLVLRDVEGRSMEEIADALGLSVVVLKTRAHRARLFPRQGLGESMTAVEATVTA